MRWMDRVAGRACCVAEGPTKHTGNGTTTIIIYAIPSPVAISILTVFFCIYASVWHNTATHLPCSYLCWHVRLMAPHPLTLFTLMDSLHTHGLSSHPALHSHGDDVFEAKYARFGITSIWGWKDQGLPL